jgi:hypothetical protein
VKAATVRKDLSIVREEVDGQGLVGKKITKQLAVAVRLLNWIAKANATFYKRKA